MTTQSCSKCGTHLPTGLADGEFDGCCPACLAHAMFDHLLEEAEDAPSLDPGEKFREFEILEVLGRGGMGVVYKAKQKSLDRIVALKVLAPEITYVAEFSKRFEMEAKLLASLNHPNIVQVHDFGREGDRHFLVMEYVDGPSLEHGLKDHGSRDLAWLLTVLRDIALGLDRVHQAGLVHRDIKPANILLAPDGTAKITDFGLAVAPESETRFTQTGAFIGTPAYVSPEHVQHETLDGRSDLYALGVMLFEGVTGEQPFQGPSSGAILAQHLNDPPPLNRMAGRAPRRIIRLAANLLAKKRKDRTPSAGALRVEIDAALPAARAYRPGRMFATAWARVEESLRSAFATPRRRLYAGTVLLFLGLLITGGVLWMSSQGRDAKLRRVEVLLRDAEPLYRHGDYESVHTRIERAREILPDHEETRFFLARVRVRKFLEDRGLPHLMRHTYGVELLPPPAEGPALEERRRSLEKDLRSFGERPLARGLILVLQEDYESALSPLAKIPELSKDRKEADFYSALCRFYLRRFEEAGKFLPEPEAVREGLPLELFVRIHLVLSLDHLLHLRLVEAADTYRETVSVLIRSPRLKSKLLHGYVVTTWNEAVSDPNWEASIREMHNRLKDHEGPEVRLLLSRLDWVGMIRAGQPADEAMRKKLSAEHEEAVNQEPDNAWMRVHLGRLWEEFAEQNDEKTRRLCYSRSSREYAEAFRLNPRYLEVAVRAAIHAMEGDPSAESVRRQLDFLTSLKESFPGNARLHFAVGNGLHRLALAGADVESSYEAAIRELETALRIEPDMADTHNILGMVHTQLATLRVATGKDPAANLENAIHHYSRRIQLAPRILGGHSGRALALTIRAELSSRTIDDRIDDYERAILNYDHAIESAPNDGPLYRNRGMSHKALARLLSFRDRRNPYEGYKKAFDDLSRAVELRPTDWGAWRERGQTRNSLATCMTGQLERQIELWKGAADDCTRALDLKGADLMALAVRGTALSNIGLNLHFKGRDGTEFVKRSMLDHDAVLKERPNAALTLLQRGACRICLGRKEEGVRDLERSIQLDPGLKSKAEYWLKKGRQNP